MTDLLQVLTDMRSGAAIADCNRKFNEMMAAIYETGKEGVISIRLKVKPSKFSMCGGVLEVETEHECKINKPELGVGRALFFVAKDGRLTRDDPNQEEMFGASDVRTNA
jgi:hypothetical protein